MKKSIIALLFAASLSYSGEITAAVAANVSYAIESLKAEFAKSHPDTKVQVILGSSGKLTAQIKNGAPYHLFMAANMKYPQALHKENLAITTPIVYAQGALAVLTLQGVELDPALQSLADKKVGKISIANPKTAPYGKASIEAFEKAGLYEAILPKLVYAENISQSVQFAMTAADVGLIAKSTLYDSKMQHYTEGKEWVSVDPRLYTPIKQGIVILKHGEGNTEAKAFYDFMLSPKAKEILKAYGYLLP